jgi:hypothetical protein
VEAGVVTIPGVGTLRRCVSRFNHEVALVQGHFAGKRTTASFHVQTQVRIYFSKAPQLRVALKENEHGKARRSRDR